MIEWRLRVNWSFQNGEYPNQNLNPPYILFSNIYFMLLLCVFVFVCVSINAICVWAPEKARSVRSQEVCELTNMCSGNQFWVFCNRLQVILSTTKQSLQSSLSYIHAFFHNVFAVHVLGHTLVARILAFYSHPRRDTWMSYSECHIAFHGKFSGQEG